MNINPHLLKAEMCVMKNGLQINFNLDDIKKILIRRHFQTAIPCYKLL